MPTLSDKELREQYNFTRDPSLAGDIADAFGAGGGDATALIQANELRYPAELATANDLAAEPKRNADGDWLLTSIGEDAEAAHAAVADAAGLEPGQLKGWDKRGDHVTYLFEMPDGRTGKDALLIDDGDLVLPEREDTPERAALRAQAHGARAVRQAKAEADEIVANARAEAARIVADAAAKAEEARKAEAEDAAKGAPPATADPETGEATPAGDGPKDYADEDLPALKKLAEQRGVEVEGTGKDGAVKKSDVIAALEAADGSSD